MRIVTCAAPIWRCTDDPQRSSETLGRSDLVRFLSFTVCTTMSQRVPNHDESDAEIWNRFSDLSPADLKALVDTLDREIAEIDANIAPLLERRNEKGEEALSDAHQQHLEEQSHNLWISYRRRDVLQRMLRHILYSGRPLDKKKASRAVEKGTSSPELSPEAQWVLDRLSDSFSFDEFMATASTHEVPPRETPDLLRSFLSKGLIERMDAGRHFRKLDT
jgi:hypothetical protein